jgi:repressor LexA
VIKTLTGRQRQVLQFIQTHLREKGYPPTLREIGREFGITSTNGVNSILNALEKKVAIKRSAKISRGLELTKEPLTNIPILGRIAAGRPVWAEENFSGSIPLDPEFFRGHKNVFALKVQGDSMTGAGIFPDDLIIAEHQATANPGDIVVALIDDTATVKKFYREKDQIRLEAANPRYTPIIITQDSGEFRITGKVIGVIRKYC